MSKNLRIIHLLAIVLALTVFARPASGQTVSVSVKGVPLRDAIPMIERQTGYNFFYSTALPDMETPVTVELKDKRIEQVLEVLFSGLRIEYRVRENKQIVLTPKTTKEKLPPPTVRGIITDGSGVPVIGATVLVVGTNNGVVSGADGSYSIAVQSPDDVLRFSFLGCEPRRIRVGNRTVIDVVLSEQENALEEVVVVAYGVQKKANMSGAVASVNFEEAGEKRALTNISAGLQGVSAGLLAMQSSGEPGADQAAVTIRGMGTLNNSSPLVVIDGIVGSMDDVNPNDVATMSVLKDAASSAIYGSRAANGVILITTKQGRQGRSRITYNGRAGFQRVSVPIDVVDNYVVYMNTINRATLNAGNVAPFGQEIIDEWAANSASNPTVYPNTDWFGATFRNAFIQEHNVQAAGGSQSVNYLVSLGYMQNDGTMRKTGYDRYSFRANVSADVTKWLRLNAVVNGNHGIQKGVDVSTTMSSLGNASPGTLPQAPDGRFGGEWAPGGNVQANNIFAGLASYDKKTRTTKLNGKLGFDITFAKNLKWYNNFAVTGTLLSTSQMNYPNIEIWDFKNDAVLITTGTTQTQLSETYAKSYGLIVDSYLQYDVLPHIEDHSLSLTAGYNQEYNYYHDSYIQALDVLSSDTDVLNAATTPSKMTGTSTDSAVRSFFGRVNYDYRGRYIFEANFRADGSSRFAKGNRWGYFPSFSAAWRISEEPFLKDAAGGWLDNLKVRASWGQLGNNSVGDYATQLIYTRRSNVFGDTAVSGAGITAIVNEGLKWETTTMTNVGVDLSLFRTRFNLSVDLFHKLTEDILVRTKIPGVFGGMDAPFRNAGQVRNRGIEIEAGWHDKIGKFEYAVSANYSYVRNKVLKYQGNVPAYSGQRILLEGYGIWDYYVREVEGIATQEKIDEMLADGYVFYPSTPRPGDFIYKDQQQEGEEGYKVINDGDRVIKGSSYPKHFFGFTLSANWQGIDFSALFSGVAGVSQYLNGTWYTNVLKNGSVINKKFLGAWSYDNPTSRIPAITTDDGGRNTVANDFWLQDASYLKLRNLTVGYTLPQKWFSPLISRCRVYFSGENLLTFTKFEGLDPETGSTSNYPNMKRYMFGVSITF